jgi:zinc transport system substrate-binding protein
METTSMKKRHANPVLLGLLATVLAGCGEPGGGGTPAVTETGGPPVVQAVNYPLMYFAQRIGGDHVDVGFLAPPDGDPAFWKPTDADIAAMQSARLILLNGAGYAKWRGYVSLPDARTVDTGRALAADLIEVEAAATHSHGTEGDHSHGGTAFTTWIDMRQARLHAEAVRDALADLVPDARSDIEANATALLADIDRLDAELEAAATRIGDRPLVASHPVYQYFARRYGLRVASVLWEPETVPDDAAMADLDALLADHDAAWMIWEGDPAPASVAKLEARGLRSIVFDPCGNRPDAGDWLDVMRRNVENLGAIDG